jgi:hypothetical protein
MRRTAVDDPLSILTPEDRQLVALAWEKYQEDCQYIMTHRRSQTLMAFFGNNFSIERICINMIYSLEKYLPNSELIHIIERARILTVQKFLQIMEKLPWIPDFSRKFFSLNYRPWGQSTLKDQEFPIPSDEEIERELDKYADTVFPLLTYLYYLYQRYRTELQAIIV